MVWQFAIPAIASLAGAVIGGMGQASTNSANRRMASAQMAFTDNQNDQAWDRNRDEATRSMEYEDLQRRHQENFQRWSIGNQMDFQRETMNSAQAYNTHMSNTSYQRGMADMKAAGLNPILAFSQGGATAPQISAQQGASGTGARGSGAQGSAPSGQGSSAVMGNVLGGAVTTATQLADTVMRLQQARENIDNTKASTALIGEQQHNVRATTALRTAEAITEGVKPDLIRASTRTEEGKPAALGAQTARDLASAGQLRAQTETEREMPELRRAQAGATIERGNLDRQERLNQERYGPRGPVAGAIGSADTIGRNIGRWIQELLQ